MKILFCHNYYQQPGGEDQVFDDETRLFESRGHEVLRFIRHNDAIKEMSASRVAVATIWNRQTVKELRTLLRRERPSVVHFANTFPLISPAAYSICRREGARVVQTLHNFRLLCPGGCFSRQGNVCEECLGKSFAWPALKHRCYRGDRRGSAVLATMLSVHRMMGTWNHAIDLYFAMTEFVRQKFIEGGFPAHKIAVKPNFIRVDPGPGTGTGGYALFVGRLTREKGVDTLLQTWSQPQISIPLVLVGDGPMAENVREAASRNPNIRWLGYQTADQVNAITSDAAFLILPSVNYEGALPKTILQAFSTGTPVIATNMGCMAEGIEDGKTGLLYTPGDPQSLAQAVNRMISDASFLAAMRQASRREFELKYTADANYEIMLDWYQRLVQHSPQSREELVSSASI